MTIPALTKIRQSLTSERIDDIPAEVEHQFAQVQGIIRPGQRVAIAVGSRGIASLSEIVKATVAWVRSQNARPLIVPAMGSHGGGTGEGQRFVLESYGVTETFTGAPILSKMAVVELPQENLPVRVYFDRNAHEADATIVINRIKPHTDFTGTYESGLMKMLAIGLGKQRQAQEIHTHGVTGLREIMPAVARQILTHANVVLGMAIVENGHEQAMRIEVMPAAKIPDREPALLDLARRSMPALPVDELDVLLVDQMGKNISGTGLDTNIIGRKMIRGEPEFDRPNIHTVIVRELTTPSHGNACGIGLADIVTRRLFEQIDFKSTYANIKTSTFLERGKIPIIAEHDREATEFAIDTLDPKRQSQIRMARIRNTLNISQMYVSPAVLRTLKNDPDIEVTGPTIIPFEHGNQLFAFD